MAIEMSFQTDNDAFRKSFSSQAKKITKSVIDKAIRDSSKFMKEELVTRTPIGIRSTPSRGPGNLREGWSDLKKIAGGFSFENPVVYAGVVEEGKYPGVGPRTVEQNGQIYSFQAAGGIVQPMIIDESFINQLSNLIEKSVERQMKKLFRGK